MIHRTKSNPSQLDGVFSHYGTPSKLELDIARISKELFAARGFNLEITNELQRFVKEDNRLDGMTFVEKIGPCVWGGEIGDLWMEDAKKISSGMRPFMTAGLGISAEEWKLTMNAFLQDLTKSQRHFHLAAAIQTADTASDTKYCNSAMRIASFAILIASSVLGAPAPPFPSSPSADTAMPTPTAVIAPSGSPMPVAMSPISSPSAVDLVPPSPLPTAEVVPSSMPAPSDIDAAGYRGFGGFGGYGGYGDIGGYGGYGGNGKGFGGFGYGDYGGFGGFGKKFDAEASVLDDEDGDAAGLKRFGGHGAWGGYGGYGKKFGGYGSYGGFGKKFDTEAAALDEGDVDAAGLKGSGYGGWGG
ncbi:hypothetical protein BJ742DRAFT_777458 [Cladochytrium replicatum]|nr:hypothetical protein BJ742DRAFT_777458 [Cladochytrium replicatum]